MSSSEVGRKFTFWVVYDSTGDQPFIKMSRSTGCLAMFDNEESAAAFASDLFGVGYKEMVLYSCPQPDAAKLVEALDLALEYWRDRQQRYKNRRPKWVVAAESALAAYRKQGDQL